MAAAPVRGLVARSGGGRLGELWGPSRWGGEEVGSAWRLKVYLINYGKPYISTSNHHMSLRRHLRYGANDRGGLMHLQ